MTLLGWKDWATGDKPTETEVQGYWQDQTLMHFADEAARDTAIVTPLEGMHVVIDDTIRLWQFYDGAAWQTYRARGDGSPEAVVTADKGATFKRTDGAAGTVLYVKTTDGADTGWSAVPDGGIAVKDADETFTRRGIRFIASGDATVEIADDAGSDEVEVTIGASGSGASAVGDLSDYKTYRKSGDQTFTSTTTLANVTGLVHAMAANDVVYFTAFLRVSCTSTTPDIKLAWDIPVGAAVNWAAYGPATTVTTDEGDANFEWQNADDAALAYGTMNGSTIVIVHGFCLNGANAGNLQLRAAQNTSDAATVTIVNNAWLEVRKGD